MSSVAMDAATLQRELGAWRYRWYWVRSICFQLLLVVSVPVFALPILVMTLLPARRRWAPSYRVARAWTQTALFLLRVLCGVRHEVQGRGWLPATPAVVMMKHQSAWETVAQLSLFPPQCWVLKQELMRIPFFGWALRSLRPIPIDRSQRRAALEQVVEAGTERLHSGLWVMVFPEGTRVAPGTVSRYRAGGAHLAVAAGVPVVPVAHNGGSCWPAGTVLKLPGTITVSIGPPLDTGERSAEEVLEATREWIEAEQKLLDPAPAPDAADPAPVR